MKHLPPLFACLFFLATGLSAQQALLGPSLRDALTQPPSSPLRVDVILQEQADLREMTRSFERDHTPLDQRARTVIRTLQGTADRTQSALLRDLEQQSPTFASSSYQIHKLWIVNMLIVEGSADLIQWLAQRPEVYYLDLSSARQVKPVDDQLGPMERTAQKSPGGKEPGLETVGGPDMWAMGYTGKGRLCFNLDTGIWDDHPSFASRFMAHHFPISQCWYGYDAIRPLDKEGSHGTHTLGTSIGLEVATQDTIGLAFNARWISSDPVATSLATVKPLSDFMFAFEWSLNPDGDTSTVTDIPDVINNSWGYSSPGDTALCFSYVSQVFDAVEAAGIANVFSVGNDGPNLNTVSEPHHISSGIVNTFTVGAVNHYGSGNPIAGFSSRGPTTCPSTGALQIKPEVVAPGVNVRSAVGHTGYGSYQGTSMAAPHVTGCVLLLKEAFPQVSGKEILEALYYSAQDMGDPGEDNHYGRGLIRVKAAYDSLALTYTPSAPIYSQEDVEVESILAVPSPFLCEETIEPSVVIHNGGDTTVQTAEVSYRFMGGPETVIPHSVTINPGDASILNLGTIPVPQPGDLEFLVQVRLISGFTESDTVNNRRIARFNLRAPHSVPFLEAFDEVPLDSSEWWVETYDVNEKWETESAGGLTGSVASARMNFADYSPKAYQVDEMISPLIELPDTGALALRFYYAYQHRHNVLSDSLAVWVSTDCGTTWDRVWYKGGRDLSTHANVTTRFTPSLLDHWKIGGADLSSYTGNDNLLLKFSTVNSFGNYLFVDSIEVYAGPAPVGLPPHQEAILEAYPNPFHQAFTLRWEGLQKSGFELTILNSLGATILAPQMIIGPSGSKEIDLSRFPNGIYFIRARYGEMLHVFKVIKSE